MQRALFRIRVQNHPNPIHGHALHCDARRGMLISIELQRFCHLWHPYLYHSSPSLSHLDHDHGRNVEIVVAAEAVSKTTLLYKINDIIMLVLSIIMKF